jgi:hypothetical protein
MDERSARHPPGWTACQDEQHGFIVWHPPDWRASGPPGRCVRLERGEPSLPEGTREVDVFLRVVKLEGSFPADYLQSGVEPADQRLDVGRGVAYTDRRELTIAGMPAVRAQFRSTGGPIPNWGVEYAIRKGGSVLDAYISRPSHAVEIEFDTVINSLDW